MNASERIGQQLPELLDELAVARVPDYFDDLLRTTAASRQRPSWASLERWLPVTSVTRPAPFGLPSWQPILLLVALLLAAALGGLLIVGATQTRIPAPFGPADNGVLLASTLDGSIVQIDPATATATSFGTADRRYYPWYSPDGTQMLFTTKDAAGTPETLYIAEADGSGARPVADASMASWYEWAPDGRHILIREEPGPGQRAWLVDSSTLELVPLDFGGIEVNEAFFRPNGTLVFRGFTESPTTWALYETPLPEVAPTPLTVPTGVAIFTLALAPDGSRLAYAYNDGPAGIRSEIHTIDLTVVPPTESRPSLAGFQPGVTADLDPLFSPDGQWLLVNRFDAEAPLGRPVLVRLDGTGDAIRLQGGPAKDEDKPYESYFSPDGAWVVVRYNEDQSVWLYDTKTGAGRQVSGLTAEGLTWQRR